MAQEGVVVLHKNDFYGSVPPPKKNRLLMGSDCLACAEGHIHCQGTLVALVFPLFYAIYFSKYQKNFVAAIFSDDEQKSESYFVGNLKFHYRIIAEKYPFVRSSRMIRDFPIAEDPGSGSQ